MVHPSSPAAPFSPSKELINMFAEGARGYLKRARDHRDDDAPDFAPPTSLDLKPAFISSVISERVQDVLVSLGGRRQAGVLETDVIAKESFPKEIEGEILELLPIDQDHGHHFCQVLLSEIKDYLKTGGVIAGRWGNVKVTDDDELAVNITKPLRKRDRTTPYPGGFKTVNF